MGVVTDMTDFYVRNTAFYRINFET
jgi:hypothetical protein